MTDSMDPLKTVTLHDAFKDEDVAALWIGPEKNTITNCAIALAVVHLFTRADLPLLVSAMNTAANLAPRFQR
jgi:hypothetical protein